MLFAVPAAYALARLRYPAKRASGFYVLATQMLPPVGLIIPYYLALQKIGALDTYGGLTVDLPHLLAALRHLAHASPTSRTCRSRWRKPPCSTAPAGCARCGT